jgi:hypothetical protein
MDTAAPPPGERNATPALPPLVPPSGERNATPAPPPVPPSGGRSTIPALPPPVPPSGERNAIPAPPVAPSREIDVAAAPPDVASSRELHVLAPAMAIVARVTDVRPSLPAADPDLPSTTSRSRRESRPRSTQKTYPQTRPARADPAVSESGTVPAPRRRRLLWLILFMLVLGAGAMAAAYFWPDLGL